MEKSKQKKINLYIVCSNKSDGLSKQWENIVKWCKDVESDYAKDERKNEFSVDIHTVGYRSPENMDSVVDSFIKFKADIVVFLFDEQEDKWVTRKFKDVLERRSQYCRPEILVYISESTLGKRKDIEALIKENSISLHEIKDERSLKTSIENNIHSYVDSYDMQRRAQKQAKINYIFLHYWYLWILLLCGIICGILKWLNDYWNQPRILIAGGGSAKSLIEQKYRKGAEIKGTFWLYSPIPTENGYRLFREELAMDVEKQDYTKRNFYSIVLAAKKASADDFLQYNIVYENDSTTEANRKEAISVFRKKGVVVGVHMGWDSLYLYSKGVDGLDSVSSIDTLKLGELICNYLDSSIIYTTNKGSGTLSPYVSFLKSYLESQNDSVINKIGQLREAKHGRIFYSKDRINQEKWIALGSKYYAPPDTNVASVKKTLVSKANPKPVYVYFMRYRHEGKNNKIEYEVPEETRDFLLEIGFSEEKIDSIAYDTIVNNDTIMLFDNYHLEPPKSNKK